MKQIFRVVDFFAGAGGLSLGFERAGFTVAAAYDNWRPAVETYRVNLGSHIHAASVTRDLDVPCADVIVGGPPCQGFSSAGARRADDPRNSLVSEFGHLVARLRPTAFVFENVEGFFTGAEGRYVFELLDPLIAAGYRIHLRKLNAANFGVPQHRKRVIGIGGLGWDPSFPKVTHTAFGAPGAHLGNGHGLPRTPSVDEALRELSSQQTAEYTGVSDHTIKPLRNADLERAKLLKPGQRMRDLPEELWHNTYRTRAYRRVMDGTPTERRGGAPSGIRRLRGDQPAKAITGGALNEFLHPKENRGLTIRECAVLQTFPLDYEFIGTEREKIQLIGNSVPPVLAQVVATTLHADMLRDRETHCRGKLLTFVPTLSSGMSPALDTVARQVRERYSPADEPQMLLWH